MLPVSRFSSTAKLACMDPRQLVNPMQHFTQVAFRVDASDDLSTKPSQSTSRICTNKYKGLMQLVCLTLMLGYHRS